MTADVVTPPSEPQLWFTCDPPCICGRPIARETDIERWIDGVASGEIPGTGIPDRRRPSRGSDPAWSLRLCWTRHVTLDGHKIVCNMKPVDPFTAMR